MRSTPCENCSNRPESDRVDPKFGRPNPNSGRPDPHIGRPEPGSGRPRPTFGEPQGWLTRYIGPLQPKSARTDRNRQRLKLRGGCRWRISHRTGFTCSLLNKAPTQTLWPTSCASTRNRVLVAFRPAAKVTPLVDILHTDTWSQPETRPTLGTWNGTRLGNCREAAADSHGGGGIGAALPIWRLQGRARARACRLFVAGVIAACKLVRRVMCPNKGGSASRPPWIEYRRGGHEELVPVPATPLSSFSLAPLVRRSRAAEALLGHRSGTAQSPLGAHAQRPTRPPGPSRVRACAAGISPPPTEGPETGDTEHTNPRRGPQRNTQSSHRDSDPMKKRLDRVRLDNREEEAG